MALVLRSDSKKMAILSDRTPKAASELKATTRYSQANVLDTRRRELERELTWLRCITAFKKSTASTAEQLYKMKNYQESIARTSKLLFDVIAAQVNRKDPLDVEVSEDDEDESKKKKQKPSPKYLPQKEVLM